MAGIGRGLVRAIVNGDIMQTRREQRGQLCRINGEFATTSAMWSSSYGCIASLVQQTKDQSSQQQSSSINSTYRMHHPDAGGDKIS